MINLDAEKVDYKQSKTKLMESMKSGDEEGAVAALAEMSLLKQDEIVAEASKVARAEVEAAMVMNDQAVLASRGVRQLTSEETKFYQNMAKTLKATAIKQELDNIELVFPETVIDQVFDDLTADHPFLSAITIRNLRMVTKWVFNTHETQLAQWGELCDPIEKEITSGFGTADMTQNKLSAFLVICQPMLDLGPVWLDRYIREILRDAIESGLEDGYINGDGDGMPIGIRRNPDKSKSQGGKYALSDMVTLKDFSPGAYGAFIADYLAKTSKGNPRRLGEILMVVNTWDYYKIVVPATTFQRADGSYNTNIFPIPTRVVPSTYMPEGEAVFGLSNRYFAGLGQAGRIEYSDEFRFLDHQRVYRTYLYGNGMPMDGNSFVRVDISGIKPLAFPVNVVNADQFPGGSGEVPEA